MLCPARVVPVLLAPAIVAADPDYPMTRTSVAPVIDGRLDDEVWDQATPTDAFTQVDPIEGALPSHPTIVRMLYDADHLYIGVWCQDSGPILARQKARDGSLSNDDHLTIVIDPFMDRRNGYVFMIGPAGAKRDGLVRGTSTQWDWDGLWQGRATRVGGGWQAELAIPFKTISFNPDTDVWGFNIQRIIRRRNESNRWASARRNVGIVSTADLGTMSGIRDIDQGYGLTLRPFATTTLELDEGNQLFDAGLDVFYQITPSTTAALTINTDFAETEVDERRVNLTRFPLFFPEKRDFFLQDAGIFSFGGINQSPLPFHSRRIGIVAGEEQGILAGVKVTGRQNRLNFGLLDVQMDHDDELGDKNLFVGRTTLDVLDESSVGLIFTNGAPGARGTSQTVGADFNYRDSSRVDGSVLSGRLFAMATREDLVDAPEEEDYAFGGRIDYDNDPWDLFLFAAQVGHDFDPALGFVSRPGEREYQASARYRFRPNGGTDFIRSIDLITRMSMYTDLSGEVNSLQLFVPTLAFASERGDFARFHMELTRENLDDPFEIDEGNVIPVGRYDWWEASTNIGTSASRAVSGNVFYAYGEFFSGRRTDWGGGLSWQPNASFTAAANFTQNEIRLPTGDFDVQIASANMDVQFTPEVRWSTILQWDNRSESAGLNSRLRWEFEPGQDVYIVYNDNYDTENDWTATDTAVVVKVGLTFRF